TEPKPEPAKNKAGDKTTAAAKKSGEADSKTEKTTAKNQTKDADKTVASAKETKKDSATTVNIIDLNTTTLMTSSQSEAQPKTVLSGRTELDKIIDSASKE